MESPWIVFFDLDGTLWDHLDVSATSPPFSRISDSVISDSSGVRITLLPGAVDFIKWVRAIGGFISTCSWNEYDKAMGALESFGLEKLFDFHKISTSPDKYRSMEQVLEMLDREGRPVHQDRLFYIDDRDIHIKDVRTRFPELIFFQIWKNGVNFDGVKKEIETRLRDTRDY